jgi:hypothetical protein
MQTNGHDTNHTPAAGAIVREGFGSQEIELSAETASTAIAAQATAAVQARYVMAIRKPRDMMNVRQAILKECARPGFAESARYSKPVGGKSIEGWSIRFAEAAIRNMTNTLVESAIIYEDAEKRIVRVSVTDLETNTTYPTDILISKTVERSQLKAGQVPIRQRQNSRGAITYLVEATEDDLLVKQGALVSKALRTNALRLIPGDILDEAEAAVAATVKNRGAQDPDAFRKQTVDGFAGIGISAANLADYLGHGVDTATVDELVELRKVGASIRDGETTWRSIMDARNGASDDAAPKPSAAENLKARMKKDPAPTSGEVRAPAEAPAAKRATATAGADADDIERNLTHEIEAAEDAKALALVGNEIEKAARTKSIGVEAHARLIAEFRKRNATFTK